MKTVGITGGQGFIGRYTVEKLLEKGYDVVVFDRADRKLFEDNPNVEFFLGDIYNANDMTELAAHVDGIIHLAGVLGTQETIQNPRPAAMTNVQGGLNFLEACSQYNLPGVNICVGNYFMDNTYSISKNTVERFTRMFNAERGGKINQLRVVNAYGPRQSVAPPFGSAKVRKITPSFVCRALSDMPIEIYGDGEQISDMVYVEDVAEALVRCLEYASRGSVFDEVVEIGPTEHYSVNQVAQTILELSNSRSKIDHLKMRPGETPGAVVTAKNETMKLIGMDPKHLRGLKHGLKSTIRYYQEQKGKTWHIVDSR